MSPAKRPTAGSRAESAGADEPGSARGQGARTRARLLDAGMAVFADRGYHAARVDDVVAHAEVSHGTFYLYFPNKQALLAALAEQCATEMSGVIAGLGAVTPDAAGRATVRAWLAEFVATYQRYGVVIRAWMEDTVGDTELVRLGRDTFGAVSASLVTRIEEAGGGPDDPFLGSVSLLALIERYTYYLTSRADGAPDAAALDTVAALVHRGWFAGSTRAA